MFDALQTVAGGLAVLLAGLATGAAWVVTIVSPNCSFDRLDYSRADGHVRELLKSASGPIAAVLLASAALAVLGGAYGSAVLSGLAALGFFSNRWTLSATRSGARPPGVRQRKKTQRVVAVGFSLMFAGVAGVAAALAVFGV